MRTKQHSKVLYNFEVDICIVSTTTEYLESSYLTFYIWLLQPRQTFTSFASSFFKCNDPRGMVCHLCVLNSKSPILSNSPNMYQSCSLS